MTFVPGGANGSVLLDLIPGAVSALTMVRVLLFFLFSFTFRPGEAAGLDGGDTIGKLWICFNFTFLCFSPLHCCPYHLALLR